MLVLSGQMNGVYSDPPLGLGQLLVLPGQMAFNLILLWTRSAACPTWTDGVYSDPPVDQFSGLSYLDRWRLL
jgi:hypothetical protein